MSASYSIVGPLRLELDANIVIPLASRLVEVVDGSWAMSVYIAWGRWREMCWRQFCILIGPYCIIPPCSDGIFWPATSIRSPLKAAGSHSAHG